MTNIDALTLTKCTGSTTANAEKFAPHISAALDRFHINTPTRQAAFFATVSVESMKLSKTEEDLYYKDPQRLADIYPRVFQHSAAKAASYARNPAALGNLLYQGYWGRGLIQLTWLKNYQAASKALGFDYVNSPNLLSEPMHAALSAGWFWDANNCNAPADAGDMTGVTLRVNGKALMHLAERKEQYLVALKVLA